MNRLNRHLFYLVGPMDDPKVIDRGKGWRNDISQFLWGLGAGVLNPCDKPTHMGQEDDETFKTIMLHKEHGNFEGVSKIVNFIVSIDLHMVDLSNAIIMKVDKDVHMCGSYFECCYAALEKKPIIVWCPQGKSNLPNWLFGMGMRDEMFFGSLEEVKEYLEHIHTDVHVDTLGKWRFLDYKKIFNE